MYLETCLVYLLNFLDLLLPKMQQTQAGWKGRLDHLLLLGRGALLGRDAAQTREQRKSSLRGRTENALGIAGLGLKRNFLLKKWLSRGHTECCNIGSSLVQLNTH